MADRYLFAFLQNCLTDIAVEQTSLQNLLWQRLLTAGFTVDANGVIGTSVAINVAFNPANLSTVVPVAKGGTALATGTSGGILGFTAAGTIASSVALTQNALVLGGGAGATPTPMASLGTTTTVLHGNAAGAPTFGAVSLTADVSGILPTANGGTGIAFFTAAGPSVARTYTFPDANATVLTSNAAVTVAQGGTGIASGTSGGVLSYTASGTLASSAALTANAIVLGGGAGVVPFSESGFTISQTGSHSLSSSTQPRAGAFSSAGQAATTAVRLTVAFDSQDAQMTNVGSMHSTTVNNSRMTVPTGGDGLYAVTAVIPWAGNATGQRQIGISKNGTIQNPLLIVGNMPGAGAFHMTHTLYLNAVATDYFECTAYQDSGGNLNVGTDGTTGRAQMYAVKLW